MKSVPVLLEPVSLGATVGMATGPGGGVGRTPMRASGFSAESAASWTRWDNIGVGDSARASSGENTRAGVARAPKLVVAMVRVPELELVVSFRTI